MTDESLTDKLVGVSAFGIGACRGFCDAQGIPVDEGTLDFMSKFGPTLFSAGYNSIKYSLKGFSEDQGGKRCWPLTLINTGYGFGFGLISGAGKGATQTAVGYGLGYALGYITK